MRQRRDIDADGRRSSRKRRHCAVMMTWMPNTASVQALGEDQRRSTGRTGSRRSRPAAGSRARPKAVLRELAQQLVVEGRRAAGRGQPVARPAHALGRIAPARRCGLLGRGCNAELFARHCGHARASDIRKMSRRLCIINLKGGLKDLVNETLAARLAAARRGIRHEALRRRPRAKSAARAHLSRREGHVGADRADRSRDAASTRAPSSPRSIRCSACRCWCSTTAR